MSHGLNRRVRVVHIIEQLGVGGAEKQLLGMLARMDRDCFEHSILYFRRMPDSMDHRFQALGVTTVCMEKHSHSIPVFLARLRRAIRSARPDVVHTWLYSANFWGRWAALLAGVSRVVASDRAEIEWTTPLVTLHERLLAHRTQRLANSRAVAESLRRFYGLDVDRIRIVYNGVSLPECDRAEARAQIRAELGLPTEQKIVMMLGRQSREKNYPMFLRAGGLVCGRRSDVTFLAVGRQDHKDEIDVVLAYLAMGDRIRWIDSRSDVQRWLSAADVFCFTSNHEGLPNAVLEAMHVGLPIVCSDFASAREVIEDGKSGILVPLNDPGKLAETVGVLLDDPAFSSRLSEQARQRARRLFSWEQVTCTMESLYAGLMAEEGRGGTLE